MATCCWATATSTWTTAGSTPPRAATPAVPKPSCGSGSCARWSTSRAATPMATTLSGTRPAKAISATAYLQSDLQRSADFRLVFREIGAAAPGELPRRELLAVRARYGVNSVYAHVCGRLGRRLGDRQPGLDRFGDRAPGDGGSEQARRAELDAKRAIAHAWAGQRPLASSRPLGVARPPSLSQASAARAGGGDRVAGAGELGWRACSW